MGTGNVSLAERSGHDKGVVLRSAETLENVVILSVVPLASLMFASGTAAVATEVFGMGRVWVPL